MGRRPLRKSGPMTGAERLRRHRAKLARELKRANPKLKAKQEPRAERERATAAKIVSLRLPGRRYGVILEDPEWRDEVWSRETGLDRSPDNHYATSPAGIILARDEVAKLAADDCVLFLWSTIQHAAIAYEVLKARGFTYASQVIWKKPSIGMGRWVRSLHEIFLIGTRGKIPCPAPGKQWPSVIEAPRGRHSEKPDKFYELIEAYFPTIPKIELNARRRRRGWDLYRPEAPDTSNDRDKVGRVSMVLSPRVPSLSWRPAY